MSEVVAVRMPGGTKKRLRMLACRLSLERNEEIRWSALVKAAVEGLLSPEGVRRPRSDNVRRAPPNGPGPHQ
jgi:hypothetical protein